MLLKVLLVLVLFLKLVRSSCFGANGSGATMSNGLNDLMDAEKKRGLFICVFCIFLVRLFL